MTGPGADPGWEKKGDMTWGGSSLGSRKMTCAGADLGLGVGRKHVPGQIQVKRFQKLHFNPFTAKGDLLQHVF